MKARSLGLAAAVGTAVICLFAASHKATAPAQFMDTPHTGAYSSRSPAGDAVRIVSWNIDRGYQLERVAATLQKNQPGLCLLQEVDDGARRTGDRDIASDLSKELSYNYAFGAEFEELSQSVNDKPAYHGQATLSRWPIDRARILRFKRQSDWWKPHDVIPNSAFFQRRLGGRVALVTDLVIGETKVVVYNVHFESRSGGAIQSAQLGEVLADLTHYPAGTAVIIGGDFNSKYHPFELLNTMEKQGFRSILGEKVERTHVILGYLDWIFYRGPWRLEMGEVVRGTHASDHDALLAELQKSPESGAK